LSIIVEPSHQRDDDKHGQNGKYKIPDVLPSTKKGLVRPCFLFLELRVEVVRH
jgi:hypothetical protein